MPTTSVNPPPRLTGVGAVRVVPRAVLGLLVAAVAACAAPEPLPESTLRGPASFSRGGAHELPDRWWTVFGDAQLDAHIEQALAGNFDLAAAWERIHEARAIAAREGADLWPQLDGTADVERSRDRAGSEATSYGVGLVASYEVDLWGRIRAAVEAESLRAAATEDDHRAAAISLSAQVALTWYQLGEARLQLALIAEQLDTNRDVLSVLETRFGVGQSGSADVLRQRQLVEATRGQQVVVNSRIELLEHQLAVLEGRPPREAPRVPSVGLPDVPPLPATGLPAELLERRPDVRGAFRRLAAADHDVAAAVRDRYPRLRLTGGVSSTADTTATLFDDWLATLAAGLVGPIVDGGLRRAEVERRAAVRRRLLAEYGQATLDALREVEDALALEAWQVQQLAILTRRLDLAESTFEQLRSQYILGAAEFIDVITALRDQQSLQRDLITARLDRVIQRIGLYRALAGGFVTPTDRDATERRSAAVQLSGGAPGGD